MRTASVPVRFALGFRGVRRFLTLAVICCNGEGGKLREGCCKSLIMSVLATKGLVFNDVVSSHVISSVVTDSHVLSALLTHCVNHFQTVVATSPHMEKTHGEEEE